MLNDFYSLEIFFDGPETGVFYEDLAKRYGQAPLSKALKAGYIALHVVRCGPEKGKWLCWLTGKGREKARALAPESAGF